MGNIQAPRGTHDISGSDFSNFSRIYESFSRLSKNYGFNGIQTPIFESIKVFDRTLGDSSDIVSKEMYVFEDRGGDRLSLRPEGTAGVVRAFLSNSWQRELPLKLFYQGPMFRYERPQKGRYRQFHQIGVEALGINNPMADAEVIALGAALLRDLGIADSCYLEINSLGDTESRDQYRKALIEYYNSKKDKLSEDSLTRLEKNPLRILDSKDKSDIQVNEEAPQLSDFLSENSRTQFERVQTLLDKAGIEFSHNQRLVRGLDYYNDVVFEFKTTELGAQDAVLSGGRYDNLVETMGGPATAGVGFAAGVERLSLLMGEAEEKSISVAFAPMSETAEEVALRLSEELRSSNISADFVYSGNFAKRMKKANKMGAHFVVIIGDDEVNNGKVSLKNFSNGEQESIAQGELVSRLIKLFSQ